MTDELVERIAKCAQTFCHAKYGSSAPRATTRVAGTWRDLAREILALLPKQEMTVAEAYRIVVDAQQRPQPMTPSVPPSGSADDREALEDKIKTSLHALLKSYDVFVSVDSTTYVARQILNEILAAGFRRVDPDTVTRAQREAWDACRAWHLAVLAEPPGGERFLNWRPERERDRRYPLAPVVALETEPMGDTELLNLLEKYLVGFKHRQAQLFWCPREKSTINDVVDYDVPAGFYTSDEDGPAPTLRAALTRLLDANQEGTP